MKVIFINRSGYEWEFSSEKEANLSLKKGWKEYAEEKNGVLILDERTFAHRFGGYGHGCPYFTPGI